MMEASEDGLLQKRGPYEHFSAKEKTQIRKCIVENGIAATARHCQKLFPLHAVKESNVLTL